MIGTTLGHYRILAKLGSGGMGEVYRAEDTKLDRDVALKVLPAELGSSPERLERFQREARAAAALDHPNIVTIYSIEQVVPEGGDSAVHFMTMQLVEGRTLEELIPDGGLPLERFFELAIPLVEAVAEAHSHGVTHRDLKPSNVMVTDDGTVKVLDFGLAKLIEDYGSEGASRLPTTITQEGSPLGTPAYMSPEQAEGKPVDHRADNFSLGVILYEMATGRRPFTGDSRTAVLSSILRDDPRPVTDVREELPRQLGRIIDHALEKAADRRIQSAIDLSNQLERLRRETSREGGPVEPASPETRRHRAGGRYRWVAWGTAAGVVLATLLIALDVGGLRRGILGGSSGWDPGISSLAVLPLEPPGGDPDARYLADGIAERMIINLSRSGELDVIPRSTVMRFQGSGMAPVEVGRELGVGAVTSVQVRQIEERLQVGVELVDVERGTVIWGNQYDRPMSDLFAIQEEIAQATAAGLRLSLSGAEERLLGATGTDDPVAFQLVFKGLAHLTSLTPEDHQTAVELFQKAIDREPDYALAHAALALGYT